jgi:para-aminobenzoate synthetase/4-amino-4-deoxychorismate lyase
MNPAGLALVRDGSRGWFCFTDPVREHVAKTPEQVLQVLQDVDDAVERGSHCMGYVSYEAAPAFDSSLHAHDSKTPCAWFREYRNRETLEHLPQTTGAYNPQYLRAGMSRTQYRRAIARIKNLLKAGATYQVNFTFPLHFQFTGDPFDLFCQLQRNQNSNHSAYVDTGDFVICSVSPELFFTKRGYQVEARPMKGTAPRMPDCASDTQEERKLLASGKNAAENVMIVDMIRNDLGRISESGSVQVRSLFQLEKYPTVFQTTSTVVSQSDSNLCELFTALFPCASVTGAPKVETMKIIRKLESTPRGVYTGAVGFVSKDRTYFNVGIRTMLIEKTGRAVYGVGSGVVWESDADEEYDECLAKAEVLRERVPDFHLLETLLWSEKSGFSLLDEHMERIDASANYFGFKFKQPLLQRKLFAHAENYSESMRVRLLLSRNGDCSIEAIALGQGTKKWRVGISRLKADSSDRFLYHKTTHRAFYDAALSDRDGMDDVLLFNHAGELTESCKANVVVVLKGVHYTPPISVGLLAGTYRQKLLRSGRLKERVLRMRDIVAADEIYLVNSVRGKIPIVLENIPSNVS